MADPMHSPDSYAQAVRQRPHVNFVSNDSMVLSMFESVPERHYYEGGAVPGPIVTNDAGHTFHRFKSPLRVLPVMATATMSASARARTPHDVLSADGVSLQRHGMHPLLQARTRQGAQGLVHGVSMFVTGDASSAAWRYAHVKMSTHVASGGAAQCLTTEVVSDELEYHYDYPITVAGTRAHPTAIVAWHVTATPRADGVSIDMLGAFADCIGPSWSECVALRSDNNGGSDDGNGAGVPGGRISGSGGAVGASSTSTLAAISGPTAGAGGAGGYSADESDEALLARIDALWPRSYCLTAALNLLDFLIGELAQTDPSMAFEAALYKYLLATNEDAWSAEPNAPSAYEIVTANAGGDLARLLIAADELHRRVWEDRSGWCEVMDGLAQLAAGTLPELCCVSAFANTADGGVARRGEAMPVPLKAVASRSPQFAALLASEPRIFAVAAASSLKIKFHGVSEEGWRALADLASSNANFVGAIADVTGIAAGKTTQPLVAFRGANSKSITTFATSQSSAKAHGRVGTVFVDQYGPLGGMQSSKQIGKALKSALLFFRGERFEASKFVFADLAQTRKLDFKGHNGGSMIDDQRRAAAELNKKWPHLEVHGSGDELRLSGNVAYMYLMYTDAAFGEACRDEIVTPIMRAMGMNAPANFSRYTLKQ